jgi:hypothetical protein
MQLPNHTLMHYRHAKVPACRKHNELFGGEIEQKLSDGSPTDLEVYLWALKVHVGLLCMDLMLPDDRRNPLGEPISVMGLTGCS